MDDNKDTIVHLLMIFMGKLHQFFQLLASFSQNSLNTNKAEIGNSTLEIRHITIGMKLLAIFINKMAKHIYNNLISKEIPAFAKDFLSNNLQNILPLQFPIPNQNNSQVPNLTHRVTLGNVRLLSMNLVKRNQGRSFQTRA